MISVVITTRGRPRQVLGVIEAARMMACQPGNLEFVIGCDEDDPDTAFVLKNHGPSFLVIDCAPRPLTVPMVTNRAARAAKGDILVILGDDGLICTPDWDLMIHRYFATVDQPELRIACLNDTANPGQPTLFALHKAWMDAAGLFDERFPCWFSDSAIGEIYSFVTGRHLPMLNITVASRPGEWNPRLKDMSTWWNLYGATRRERLEVASHIRGRLQLTVPAALGDLIALWEDRDRKGLPASEEIVHLIGNPALPTQNYLKAKAQAEEYLARHKDVATVD